MLRNILYLSIIAFIIIIASLVLTVYHTSTATTISHDIEIQITPIPSGFDLATAASLKAKDAVPAGDLSERLVSSASGSVIPTPALNLSHNVPGNIIQNKDTQFFTATPSSQPNATKNL